MSEFKARITSATATSEYIIGEGYKVVVRLECALGKTEIVFDSKAKTLTAMREDVKKRLAIFGAELVKNFGQDAPDIL